MITRTAFLWYILYLLTFGLAYFLTNGCMSAHSYSVCITAAILFLINCRTGNIFRTFVITMSIVFIMTVTYFLVFSGQPPLRLYDPFLDLIKSNMNELLEYLND